MLYTSLAIYTLLGVGVVKGGVSRMHHNNAGVSNVCCAQDGPKREQL